MVDDQSPGHVVGFYHAGVTVRDMDSALRFYVDGLGLELAFQSEAQGPQAEQIWGSPGARAKVSFLRVPGSSAMVELFEFRDPERHSASARPQDFGAGHFCLYVEGIDAMFNHLVEMGYRARSAAPVLIITGPRAGCRAIYTIDPDGYHVEMYEQAPAAS